MADKGKEPFCRKREMGDAVEKRQKAREIRVIWSGALPSFIRLSSFSLERYFFSFFSFSTAFLTIFRDFIYFVAFAEHLFIYFNFWFSRAMVPSPKKATRSSPRKKAWGSPSKALPKSIFVRFRISWQGDVILSKKDHKRSSFGISKGHFRKLAFFLENV